MITETGLLEGLQMELMTVDSLAHALPPLAPLEEMGLTKKLQREGCRETVKVFIYEGKYVIVDGHNRYRICKEHKIPFKVEVLPIKSLEKAKEWLIETQLGRRNVSNFVKCEFVLPMRESLIKEGRRRQGWRKKECDVSSDLMKADERVNTQRILADLAGVSVGTLVSAKWLIENAAERTKEDLRKGIITIYMAYTETRDLLKSDDVETRQKVFSGELTIQEIVEARKEEAAKRESEEAKDLKNDTFVDGGDEDDGDDVGDEDDVDGIYDVEYDEYGMDIPDSVRVVLNERQGMRERHDGDELHEKLDSPHQDKMPLPHFEKQARPVFPGYGLVSEPEPTPEDVRLPAPALDYDGTPMKSYGGAPEEDLEYRGAAEFQYVRSETRRILGYFTDRMTGIISDISPTTATESNLTELMSMLDEGFTTLRNKIMEVMNNG